MAAAVCRPAQAPWPRAAHQRRPSAGAETSPTTGWSSLHQRDQGRPDRHPADEVLGAVDRVDHPLSLAGAGGGLGGAELLPQHPVAGPGPGQRGPQRLLYRGVGVGHRREIRLGLHVEVQCPEPGRGDRVGGVCEHMRQRQVVGVTGGLGAGSPSAGPGDGGHGRKPIGCAAGPTAPALIRPRPPVPLREASNRRYEASRRGSAWPSATHRSRAHSPAGSAIAVVGDSRRCPPPGRRSRQQAVRGDVRQPEAAHPRGIDDPSARLRAGGRRSATALLEVCRPLPIALTSPTARSPPGLAD